MMAALAIEARLLLRDRAHLLLLLLLASLCLTAVLAGHTRLIRAEAERAEATAAATEAADAFATRLASDLSPEDRILTPVRVRLPVDRPVPPLLDFSAGRSGVEPASATIGLRTRPETLTKDAQLPNPLLLANGSFDLGFVGIVVAPLILVVLGTGLFATDRDMGTARLILVQGGSPARALGARSLVRAGPVLAILLIAIAALALLGPPGRGAAILAWGAALLALLAAWWATILLANACRIGSETAAFALIAAWAILTLVAPAAITLIAGALNPPPSRFAEIATSRAAEVAATTAWETDHPELLGQDAAGLSASLRKSSAIATAIDRAVSPIGQEFADRLAAQQQLVATLAWLSPPMVAQLAMEDTAGTGIRHALAFRTQAADQVRALRTALDRFVADGRGLTPADYRDLPRFVWELPAANPGPAIAWLIAIASIALLAARHGYRQPLLA